VFRAGFEAVNTVAQKNLVAVQGKNLLLGEVPLNLQSQDRFLHFAAEMALRREEQVTRELHGERGCSLRPRPGTHIAIGGSHHAPEVDTPVLLKRLVFSGEDGVTQYLGKFVIRSQHAALQGERSDLPAMIVIKFRDGAGAIALKIADLGKVG